MAAMILLIGINSHTYAQNANGPADEAKRLQLTLKLTDAQTTKLTTVLQQIQKQQMSDKTAQANMKNWQATHNTKAMIDYVLKQMDANAYKIEQVLTPEQNKTFKDMLGKRRDALQKMEAAQK